MTRGARPDLVLIDDIEVGIDAVVFLVEDAEEAPERPIVPSWLAGPEVLQ